MIGVYKITNPKNEMYIGQSSDIELRFKSHKRNAVNKKLKESFEKYGIENHRFEVLLECSLDELKKKESELIIEHRKTVTLFNASDYESFAGKPKGNRYNVKYWTDEKMHATISQLVTARKCKELTDEVLSRVEKEALKSKK